jgi:hypothetical protein
VRPLGKLGLGDQNGVKPMTALNHGRRNPEFPSAF